MKRVPVPLVILLAIIFSTASGYASMTPTQQRALSSGAIGAAAGAGLGAIAGNATIGAAIGGPAGLTAGALWGDIERQF